MYTTKCIYNGFYLKNYNFEYYYSEKYCEILI